jgi:large subunit ribosomal protein L5
MNPMKAIKIEKITLNIGCGTKLNIELAKKVLEMITERKAVITRTKKRTTFNVPKNKPIGSKITVRFGTDELLKRLLEANENKLKSSNFDNTGNFSFGVKEYIDVPGVEYDPTLGIIGFDVSVTLQRPGYRVKKKRGGSRVGKKHAITKEEAMVFVREKFRTVIE